MLACFDGADGRRSAASGRGYELRVYLVGTSRRVPVYALWPLRRPLVH